jgi:endonuclease YncB( thermonuclease family)
MLKGMRGRSTGAAAALALFACTLVSVSSAGQGAGSQAGIIGPATAKEGDLIIIKDQEWRLFGIDAPDEGQRCQNVRGRDYDCFKLSQAVLAKFVAAGTAECQPRPSGKVKSLAVCRVNGVDLGEAMVRTGYALAYRAIAPDYVGVEAEAISFRRGLWGGRVEPPWLWRSRRMEERLKAGRAEKTKKTKN